MSDTTIEIGWPIQGNTGWGLFALYLALGLQRIGHDVVIPGWEPSGIPKTLWPSLTKMMEPRDHSEHRVRFDPWGNHAPDFQETPNRTRVLLAVFEDTEAIRPDVMNRFDLVLSPSRWVQDLLASHDVSSTLWHQGYDSSLFYPAPKRRADDRFMVFSGGKLEYRKGQDIVVEAFKRFRETPEGKDAILVTAWENLWPATMEGIWTTGYVQGVPVQRGSGLDIPAWLEANGIPREANINLGLLSQAEMANAIRECDVGLFPNRCEGATNMAAAEFLGCGRPALIGAWAGQDDLTGDITSIRGVDTLRGSCGLYRGTEGWQEASVDQCVHWLQWYRDKATHSIRYPVDWREAVIRLDGVLNRIGAHV